MSKHGEIRWRARWTVALKSPPDGEDFDPDRDWITDSRICLNRTHAAKIAVKLDLNGEGRIWSETYDREGFWIDNDDDKMGYEVLAELKLRGAPCS